MRTVFYQVAMIGLLLLISCTDANRDILTRAQSILQEHPDSALAILGTCDRYGLSQEGQARYSLLYTWAQDKSGLDVSSDSLIRVAYDYYQKVPDDTLYARCMYYMGKYYVLCDSTKPAEDCLRLSAQSARERKDYYTEYLALSMLSQSIKQLDPHQAAMFARQALKAAALNGEEHTANYAYLLLKLGDAYNLYPQPDSALVPYTTALQIGRELNDNYVVSSALQDLALYYSRPGYYHQALEYGKQAWSVAPNRTESLAYNLACRYSEVDSLDQANSLLLEITKSDNANRRYGAYKQLFRNQVRDGLGREYADSAFNNLEYMYADIRTTKAQYFQESVQLADRNIRLKAHATIRTVILSAATCISILIVLTLYIVYRSNKKLTRQKYALQKQQVELELRNKQLQIDTMRDFLIRRLDFMVEFNNSKGEKFITLTDEHWQEIETFLDGADNLFVQRMRKNYPQLREKDLQFCMLVRLGISTRILSCVCHINERSIKQKLLHFKEKLGITSSEISLRKFIQDM